MSEPLLSPQVPPGTVHTFLVGSHRRCRAELPAKGVERSSARDDVGPNGIGVGARPSRSPRAGPTRPTRRVPAPGTSRAALDGIRRIAEVALAWLHRESRDDRLA